jgi:hypothetical protein
VAALVNAETAFAPTTLDNLPGKLFFAITELDELVDAIDSRMHPEDHIPVEVADTGIWLLSALADLYGTAWASRVDTRKPVHGVGPYDRPEMIVWPIIRQLRQAGRAWSKDEPTNELQVCLELAVLAVFRVADRFGVNLEEAILAKLEVNRSRGARHGRRRSLG